MKTRQRGLNLPAPIVQYLNLISARLVGNILSFKKPPKPKKKVI